MVVPPVICIAQSPYCHPASHVHHTACLHAQDHQLWDRPENLPHNVPAYVVTKDAPGSDVTGAMGASLAVGSLVWQKRDPAYAAKLLAGAKKLYK